MLAAEDSDDERIVRWLVRTFNRWLQDGHMPGVVLRSPSPPPTHSSNSASKPCPKRAVGAAIVLPIRAV